MKMKTFLRIAIFLLALNFLAENFGYFTHQLYQLVGIICLIFYGLSIFPANRKTRNRGLLLTGYFLLIVSIFFFSGPLLSRLTGTAVFLYSMGLVLKSRDSEEKEIPLLISTVAICFFFFLFYLYSPPFWNLMRGISFSFSSIVSRIAGTQVMFSSTFLGLPVFFVFLIFILIIFFRSGKQRPTFLFKYIISLILLSGLYLVAVDVLPGFGKSIMELFTDKENFFRLFLGFLFEKDYPLTHYNYQMNAPLILFVFYLIPLFFIIRGSSMESVLSETGKAAPKNSLAVFLIITSLAACVLTVDLPGRPSEKNQVVFYNKGFLNWNVPNFRMFGSKSAGMFGILPRFVESMGFTSVKTDTISKEVLQQAKILMMINIDREIPREELEAVWDFVENGGSLLLLGDHTFYKHGVKRIFLNDILKPYSIRFNFDSADWFVGGWLHSYQYVSHPVTAGMKDDMNNPGIVIGASISTSLPAFPLVIGKYGYSDPGNDSESGAKRGYLGNLNYDPGEPMGDVVLCSAQHYGRGKVMVFGDTSGFANAILVNTHDFINRVFTWLAREESPRRFGLTLCISLVLFMLAFFFCRESIRKPGHLISCLILTLMIVKVADNIKQHNSQRDLHGNIAYIDTSHGERFSSESWNENAIMGLHLNLMRNGYLSFSLKNFERKKLEQADILVLVAPSAPFTKKEIRWINDFVNKGGTLILTVGWEERQASESLMEVWGFSIEHLPLAQFISIIPDGSQKVRFYEAWPVNSSGSASRVIAAYRKYPVVVEKRLGDGRVILIGDSSFFWNKNLEMEESHISENINFLQWLLTPGQLKKGAES